MLGAVAKKIFGTKNARELKKMQPIAARINDLEAAFRKRPTPSSAR